MIYLNYASTVPISMGVQETIVEALKNDWMNPNDTYSPAMQVREKVEEARAIVAKFINADPDEIIFTSSGSAANALALPHVAWAYCSAVEHSSVLKNTSTYHRIAVDDNGRIKPNTIGWPGVDVLSVMMANNEIGTINDIKDLAVLAHKYNALIHTDATQYIPYYKVDVKDLDVDMLSFSGHKIGAPAGFGVLYIRKGLDIPSLIRGNQEKGLFAGTENVPYILGLATAIKQIDYSSTKYIKEIRDYFESKILTELNCGYINAYCAKRVPHISSVVFPGKNAKQIQTMLELEGIYVSTGSACNESSGKPSHVLEAIGIPKEDLYSCVRFSFGKETTLYQIDVVIDTLKRILEFV